MYTRNVQKEVRDMLKVVSDDTGLEYKLVEDIFFHEFKFVAKQIQVGQRGDYSTFKNILIKHFGSFLANERHIYKLKQINDEREAIKDKDIV
jgi:hypothetical protein